jgi:hypothetical protein
MKFVVDIVTDIQIFQRTSLVALYVGSAVVEVAFKIAPRLYLGRIITFD